MKRKDRLIERVSGYLSHLLSYRFCVWLLLSVLLPGLCIAEEAYRYQRIWPTLPQPWYFNAPEGVAIDIEGNVYVADTGNCRIQKLTADGQFITQWGKLGTGNGEFLMPTGIAVDRSGNVYVADYTDELGGVHHNIQKFTSDGRFLARWENPGAGDGQFDRPRAVAVDDAGNVFITDAGNSRVQKLSPDGRFIAKWGSKGSGEGELQAPTGIAVDAGGNVYVTDKDTYFVQKFTSDGQFVTRWGGQGEENGQFMHPWGIEVDGQGNVFVADPILHCVQKFTSDGSFLARWENFGNRNGQFVAPHDVAVDIRGNVYIADATIFIGDNLANSDGIHKFTSDGQFLAKWSSFGGEDGQFDQPWGAAIDSEGNVYVSDTFNHRIQKFTSDGRFLTKWGSLGQEDGQFKLPRGITIDSQGYVYVADWGNSRVQKFTSDGHFVLKWGEEGLQDWFLYTPIGVAVDGEGHVYVLETKGDKIKKFTSDGQFITEWGEPGSGAGQFLLPKGITIDSSGRLYVADSTNQRIQEFTLDGQFVASWGAGGKGDGEFNEPYGIAADSNGNLYVADTNNYRIQKFTASPSGSISQQSLSSAGQPGRAFAAKWGSMGNCPDQMSYPKGLAIAQNGSVYAVDSFNNRIQVFSQVDQDSGSKAIIVAGGGPFPGNHLWDATQRCASFCYRALLYQGFKKENIRYLSTDTTLDLDDNGIPDVYRKDSLNNIRDSIVNWASNAGTLLLYLTDHGGDERFLINQAKEVLLARSLASWLDAIPDTRVIVVYDACYSGSFIEPLTASGRGERIVITSAGSKERAYFGNLGTLSFSNFFWTQVFNGASLAESFTLARKAITLSLEKAQCPLVEADGDGKPGEPADVSTLQKVTLTRQTSSFNTPPRIDKVYATLDPQHPNKASLLAEGVEDEEGDGISRLWAVIRPPNFRPGDPGNPLYQLPYVDLTRVGETGRYEGAYEGFCVPGTYQVAFYAMDRMCNVSTPRTAKLVIESPLRRKVILAAGWSSKKALQSAARFNMQLAYKALRAQGYPKEDILALSSMPGMDGLPIHEAATRKSLMNAIKSWAREDTQDLVVYLIGEGLKGRFQISKSEALTGEDLSTWLDGFQSFSPGTRDVIVLYDACRSGSFLASMRAGPEGKHRVLVTSTDTDQPACFLVDGLISFSRFFWVQVLDGADLANTFLEASNAIKRSSGSLKQRPLLDADGNGKGNEAQDGRIIASLQIGIGTNLAGNAPVICDTCVGAARKGATSASIWARNITTTGKIDRVLAVIIPPGYRPESAIDPITDLPTVDLKSVGKGKYQGIFKDLKKKGRYDVAVYAVDTDGNISLPQNTKISK